MTEPNDIGQPGPWTGPPESPAWPVDPVTGVQPWQADQDATAVLPPVHQAQEAGPGLWEVPPDGVQWQDPQAASWGGPPAVNQYPGAMVPYDPYSPYAQYGGQYPPYDPYAPVPYGGGGLPPLPAPRPAYVYASPLDADMKRGMPVWHIPLLITFVVISLLAFTAAGYTFGRWGGGASGPAATYAAGPAAAMVATSTAADTSTTAATTSTADTSATASAGSGAGNGPAPSVAAASVAIAKAPEVKQAPMVAYRSGGYFWVANEQGGAQKKLIPAPGTATFAISPDGKWLAVADGDNGVLHVINTSTGAETKPAGVADAVKPSWSPDSSFVVYCGTDTDKRMVKQVKTDGSKPIVLTAGTAPRVAPDGKTIYFIQMPGADEFGPIALINAGVANGKTTVVFRGNAQEVAVVQEGIVYAGADPGTNAANKALFKAKLDGSSPSVLVPVPKIDGADSFGNLFVTRDGKSVAYDVVGAAGFARLGIVAFGGGAAKDVSGGKDSYTLGWLSNGSAVTYTTGNIATDPSAKSDLYVVGVDGSNNHVLVAGGAQ